MSFVFLLHNSHSEALHYIITITVWTVQSNLLRGVQDLLALPVPPEQPAALHPSILVTELIPLSLNNTTDIIGQGADKCFQIILLVPQMHF